MSNTTEKKEFAMNQVFAMWLKKGKKGNKYLTGSDGVNRLVGFFNGRKKNPKEPDVRVFVVDDQGKPETEPLCALWVNVSKNDKKYLSGKVGEKRVVGFINTSATVDGKRPYFSVYESDSAPQKKETLKPAADAFVPIPDGLADELPFN